jgi:hypothetical protein
MKIQAIVVGVVIGVLPHFASAQWVSIPQSPRGTCLAVSGSNILVGRPERYGSHGALFVSTDNGANWDTTYHFPVNALAVSSAEVFAASGDRVAHSSDSGLNWFRADSIGHPVTSIAVSGTDLFAGTSNGGIFRSSDSGQSWIALSPQWTSTTVWTFAVSGTKIFAGTTGGVVLSEDNGASWPAANSGLPALDVRALAANGGAIYAGIYQKGVYRTTDFGYSWSEVKMGLSDQCGGKAFAFYGADLYTGTDCGVFHSANGGATWAKANSGLTDTLVLALAVSGDNLLALTYNGLWTRPLSDLTSVGTTENSLPSSFGLDQNYPNPFNPKTVVSCQSLVAGRMKLVVYDLLGREVKELMDEQKAPGKYQVEFDGTKLSSGVYIYRLTAGNYVDAKQMVLVK